MAFKQDSFWEDHPPVEGAKPWEPGLRAFEVVTPWRIAGFAVLWTILLTVAVIVQIKAPDWLGVFGPLALPFVFFLSFLSISVNGMTRRYRLYDEESMTPALDGQPLALPVLLRRVALSDQLMLRLALPESTGCLSSAVQSLSPETIRPPAIFSMALFTILTGLLALIILPDRLLPETGGFTLLLILVVCFVIPLIFYAWAYRRVRMGIRVMGTGVRSRGEDHVLFRFEDIAGVALRWDHVLGRPFLLLDVNGAPLRYYGTSSEPLHLLRIAKYRMPHLKLHARGLDTNRVSRSDERSGS